MRSADEQPDEILVVDPRGRVRSCVAAEAVNHAIVDEGGNVREHMAARGYVRLDDMYEADDLGERGYAVYLDWRAARKAGKQGDMPAHWLPAELKARRAKQQAERTWTAPPPDADVAPAPKRVRKRRRSEREAAEQHKAIEDAEHERDLRSQAIASAADELGVAVDPHSHETFEV